MNKYLDESLQYFKKALNLSCSFDDLSEDMLNHLVDSKLEVIDSNSDDSINEYLYAIGMLEWWLEVTKSTRSYKEVFNEFLTEKYKECAPPSLMMMTIYNK